MDELQRLVFDHLELQYHRHPGRYMLVNKAWKTEVTQLKPRSLLHKLLSEEHEAIVRGDLHGFSVDLEWTICSSLPKVTMFADRIQEFTNVQLDNLFHIRKLVAAWQFELEVWLPTLTIFKIIYSSSGLRNPVRVAGSVYVFGPEKVEFFVPPRLSL